MNCRASFTFLLIATSLLLYFSSVYAADREALDWIVAEVNDDVIVNSDLEQRANTLRVELAGTNTPMPDAASFRKQVLERLILERIQLHLARSLGIEVDDVSLDNTVKRIAAQNNVSIDELRQRLESEGYSLIAFREQLRTDIILKKLRKRQVENRVNVTEHEIDAQLAAEGKRGLDPNAELQLLHILIAIPEAASTEEIQAGRNKANAIVEKLRSGDDFRETAVAVSDGRQALKGGDLGWRKLGQLPTIFVDKVINMSIGDISDPIRSPSGFHIIKLENGQAEARKIITQTHARHILIKVDELNTDQKVKSLLTDLRERIIQGEDFSVLAKAHSQDPGSAAEGGDLGWAKPGSFVPAFETVMNGLDINEISMPFRSQYGWHILQVLERRDYDNTGEYRREQVRAEIRKRKLDEELNLWLRRLRDEAYVEYRATP